MECSEVDAELGTEHDRVVETPRPAGLKDVLEVGLDEFETVILRIDFCSLESSVA
jgi:hypothetical protein